MKKGTGRIIRFLYISFFALVASFLLLLQFGIIRYNESPSMPYGFYIKAIDSSLKEGSVVLLENKWPNIVSSQFIIKKIDHFEGQRAYLKGSTPEEIYNRCKVEGLYSFDSDFFGFVDKSDLIKLYPLLTWNKLL